MDHVNDERMSPEKSEKVVFRNIPIEIYKKLEFFTHISHPLTDEIVAKPWKEWIVISRKIISRWKSNRYKKE